MRLPTVLVVVASCGQPATNPDCADPPRGDAFGGFADVTEASGVVFRYGSPDFNGGALAIDDLDGDGRVDIVAGSRLGGSAVFRNLGGLTFGEVTDSGLDPSATVRAIALADLDGDDDRDIVTATSGETRIYENRGDATFEQAAVLPGTGATEHVLASDLDGDGRLDLYLGNYHTMNEQETSNRLYLNRGGLQFELARVDGTGRTWTSTAYDFDDDGDQDLYVANDTLAYDFGTGPMSAQPYPVDAFLRNDGLDEQGLPRFTDVAADQGMTEARSSMGGLLADFDDDGLLDLFVPNYGVNKLFVRDTDGRFVERASALGLAGTPRVNEDCRAHTDAPECLFLAWAAAMADFDLDGHDELIVTSGYTAISSPPPIRMFVRGDAGGYEEASPSLPCLDVRSVIATDLDDDGDEDLVMAPIEGALRVFENTRRPSPDSWLRVRLQGPLDNRDAFGATVSIEQRSGRVQTRAIGTGGLVHGTRPAEAHFSVTGDPVEAIRIRWPDRAETIAAPQTGAITLAQP